MRGARSQRGLTLVEVLSTSLMVSVALMGTAGAALSASRLQEVTTHKREAARQAASVLDDLRASDLDSLIANHDGTVRAIDVGGGKKAAAQVSVRTADAATTAAPVYRIELRIAFPDDTGLDDILYVTHACDHKDLFTTGAAPAEVTPPDGAMLDWVTDIEKKKKNELTQITYYETTTTTVTESEWDDGGIVTETDTELVAYPVTYEIVLYDSLSVESVQVYDALETLIAPDYQ